MDAYQFDQFARVASRSRRAVAVGLLGLTLSPMTTPAKRKKHKKKKKPPTSCTAPSFLCGTSLCCGGNQQCVSGQCKNPEPSPGLCGSWDCAGFTNPVWPVGGCVCRATTSGPTLCFANQACGGLTPCGANGECSEGYACMAQSCGGNPTCVRTCI